MNLQRNKTDVKELSKKIREQNVVKSRISDFEEDRIDLMSLEEDGIENLERDGLSVSKKE